MNSDNDNQRLQNAVKLHQAGKLDEAAQLYRKLIERDARNFYALHYLGVIEATRNDFAQAKPLIEKSIALQPDNVPFLETYASILFQMGEYDAAQQNAGKGLQLQRNNVQLLYVSAIALVKMQRLPDSLAQFNRLLSIVPNHAVAFNERGSVLAELKDYDAALTSVEKALTFDPKYAGAYLNKGKICDKLERYDEALAAYGTALALDPGLTEAWRGKASVLRELKRFDESLAAYDRALALKPDFAWAWLGRGNVFAELNRWQAAADAYGKATALQPDIFDAWFGLGIVLAELKRYDDALSAYDKALNLSPDHPEAWLARGNVFFQTQRYDEAVTHYNKAIAIRPKQAISLRYMFVQFTSDVKNVVYVLEKLLALNAGDPQKCMFLLSSLLWNKECLERIEHGQLPEHAATLDDQFFNFAGAELAEFRRLSGQAVETRPDDATANLLKFFALFCSRDRRGAQACLDVLKRSVTGDVLDAVTFDPDFYRQLAGLNDDEIVKGLAPLLNVVDPDASKTPMVYLSCDFRYFVHLAAPMIKSLCVAGPGAHLHAHLIDVTNNQIDAAVAFCQGLDEIKISISAEQPQLAKAGKTAARNYFHAIRFLRFYQLLKQFRRPLWLMDVDGLFNRAPDALFARIGNNDVAFRMMPGRLEPWNQFHAAIVAGTPTPASLEYFRLIAAFISHHLKHDQLRWGIDQLALYTVFEHLREQGRAPSVHLLNQYEVDTEQSEQGFVWCSSTKYKYYHTASGQTQPNDNFPDKYLRSMDRYYSLVKSDPLFQNLLKAQLRT